MRGNRFAFVLVALAAVAVVLIGCGGGKGSGSEAAKPAEPSGPSPAEQGQAMGQEIITAFDETVAEAAALLAGKPAPEELLPQLEALFTKAEARMTELNGRYLELRAADVEAFGACNSYIDEYRPKSVHAKDMAFGDFIGHYRFENPNPEVEEFLTGNSLAALIDLATKKQ